MTPPVRHLLSVLAVAVLLAAVGLAVLSGKTVLSRPGVPPEPQPPEPAVLPSAPDGDPLAGLADVLAVPPRPVTGALAKRFRLAGIIHGTDGEYAVPPMAVFDDRVAVRQSVVQQGGEVIPGVLVTRIEEESVVLQGPDGEERLTIEKTAWRSAPRSESATVASRAQDAASGPLDSREAAAARFGGEELFPGRWHFDREKVIAYYDELRSEPERLLAIFDSMDPNYVEDKDGNRSIDGYLVGAEGEKDFFLAAGLRDGDVVKRVNKCAMTSRVFAEGLISAFVEGSATLFVLEIERDGKTIEEVVEIE